MSCNEVQRVRMIVQGSRRSRVQRVGGRMLHWMSEDGLGRRPMSVNERDQYRICIWMVKLFISGEGIDLTGKDESNKDDNAYFHRE